MPLATYFPIERTKMNKKKEKWIKQQSENFEDHKIRDSTSDSATNILIILLFSTLLITKTNASNQKRKEGRKEGRNKAEIRELWRHIMRMCFHILNSAKLNLIISASPFRSIITLKRKRCHFFGQKQNHCESLATQMNHAGALLFNFAPLLKTLSSSVPWIFQL